MGPSLEVFDYLGNAALNKAYLLQQTVHSSWLNDR